MPIPERHELGFHFAALHVLAPLGAIADALAPPSSRTLTSMVGFPRESRTSNPSISTILVIQPPRITAAWARPGQTQPSQ